MSYIPESDQESDVLQPKNQIKADFKGLFKGVYFFLKELLDIKSFRKLLDPKRLEKKKELFFYNELKVS